MDLFTVGKTAFIKGTWPAVNLHCPVVSGIILFCLWGLRIHKCFSQQHRRKLSKENFNFGGCLCLKTIKTMSSDLRIFETLRFNKGITTLFFFRVVLRMFHIKSTLAYLISTIDEFFLLAPEQPDTVLANSVCHSLSLPEVVWCEFSEWCLSTDEWGLHKAGGNDQRHEESPFAPGTR